MSPLARRSVWIVAACVAAGLVAITATAPSASVVVGRSMLPGLADGDGISIRGWRPRWRPAQRHERWLVQMPDGTPLVKRIAGLPGEQLALVSGALMINGELVLPSPEQLRETASRVGGGFWKARHFNGVTWMEYQHLVEDPTKDVHDPKRLVPGPIYDSLDEDAEERRLLHPVSQVGIAAIVEVATGSAPTDVFVRVGPQAAAVHLRVPGRYQLLAARIAGRFVVSAFPIDHSRLPRPLFPTSPLQWPAPAAWSLVTDADPLTMTKRAPLLAVGTLDADPHDAAATRIQEVLIWRPAHLLPAPDGTHRWTIPPGHVFLLGDHPAASRDSRTFGPVATSTLVAPITRRPARP